MFSRSIEYKKCRFRAVGATIFIIVLICGILNLSINKTRAAAIPNGAKTRVTINVKMVEAHTPIKEEPEIIFKEQSDFKVPVAKPKKKKEPLPQPKKVVEKPVTAPKPVEPEEEVVEEKTFVAEYAQPAQEDDEQVFGASDNITLEDGHIGQEEVDRKQEAVSNILVVVEKYKKYPKNGRRAAMEGTVKLRISINAHGVVEIVILEESSGYGVLDSAAKVVGKKLVGLQVSETATPFNIIVPIEYRLE